MAQNYGSLLLSVRSNPAPQTCEDPHPQGCWEGTWERGGSIFRTPCVDPFIYSLLSIFYSPEWKLLWYVMMA